MKFLIQTRHTLLSITLAVILSVLGGWFILGGGATETQTVSAGFDPFDNVSGWAWSSNIGWISFNNKDCDTNNNGYVDVACGSVDDASVPSKNYTVRVDETNRFSAGGTGAFSGWAWSSNIGWVSFNQSDTGTTTSPLAYVEWGGANAGRVTGWARALSGCQAVPGVPVSSCSSNDPGLASGGWDGWIKLNPTGNSLYDVYINSDNTLSGYAWGGDVVGWIRFSGTATDGSSYDVKFTPGGPVAATGCGTANGVPTVGAPAANLCGSGPASTAPSSSGLPKIWTWKCDVDTITCTAPFPQCSDGIDNDGDTKIDRVVGNEDTGCSSPSDTTERDFKFKEF